MIVKTYYDNNEGKDDGDNSEKTKLKSIITIMIVALIIIMYVSSVTMIIERWCDNWVKRKYMKVNSNDNTNTNIIGDNANNKYYTEIIITPIMQVQVQVKLIMIRVMVMIIIVI